MNIKGTDEDDDQSLISKNEEQKSNLSQSMSQKNSENRDTLIDVGEDQKRQDTHHLAVNNTEMGKVTSYSHEILVNKTKTSDDIEYDKYMFSVGQKLDLRTRKLTFKKIRYIMDEVLEDFSIKKLKTIELHLAVIYIFFLFFLRMWTHYVGQYFVLTIMGVPVTRFETHWHKIYIKYAAQGHPWDRKNQGVFISNQWAGIYHARRP